MLQDIGQLDPGARVQALTGHHVWELPPREAELLALWTAGMSDAECASSLEISKHTVESLSASVRHRVVLQPMAPTHANAQAWAHIHGQCCLATVRARYFLDRAVGQND
ncbi:MAG: LuxR C-terminal-related transcriptional regulator [Dehalococcoidia bacterium]